jgi:hypothetical protein
MEKTIEIQLKEHGERIAKAIEAEIVALVKSEAWFSNVNWDQAAAAYRISATKARTTK